MLRFLGSTMRTVLKVLFLFFFFPGREARKRSELKAELQQVEFVSRLSPAVVQIALCVCLCCALAGQWLLTLRCVLLAPLRSVWLHFQSFLVPRVFSPPSLDLYALDVVNSEVTCLCALLRLINSPASVSISAGAASPRGRDAVSEQCRAVRDTMLPLPALWFSNSPKC